MVTKAMLTLEGTMAYLLPELSFLEIIEPMGEELYRQRLSGHQIRRWFTESMPS